MKKKKIRYGWLLTGLLLSVAIVGLVGWGKIGLADKPKIAVPPSGDEIDRFLDALSVKSPMRHRNLTIFPVVLDRPQFGLLPSCLSLGEAMKKGVLEVYERGSAQVNQVAVRNRSSRHVFIMASEMIQGGKQDRMAADDALVPPHSGKVYVRVYCVEHGRWVGKSSQFSAGVAAAAPTIRQHARASKSQATVWDRVAKQQESLGVSAETGTMRSVYESEKVQEKCRPYIEELEKVPSVSSRTCGVVVAVGEEIVCADLFYRPDLFRELWPKLLRSYVMDAIGKPEKGGTLSASDAERYLARVYRARRIGMDTPGSGQAYELTGGGINGSALIHQTSVVHLEAFPGLDRVVPLVRPEDQGLQYRRERLER